MLIYKSSSACMSLYANHCKDNCYAYRQQRREVVKVILKVFKCNINWATNHFNNVARGAEYEVWFELPLPILIITSLFSLTIHNTYTPLESNAYTYINNVCHANIFIGEFYGQREITRQLINYMMYTCIFMLSKNTLKNSGKIYYCDILSGKISTEHGWFD